MQTEHEAQMAVARLGGIDCAPLLGALGEQGWCVETVETIEHLLALVDTGRHQLVLVATDDPWALPKGPMRSLMGLQGSMALVFLVPDRAAVVGCPALIGTTSDQIHTLDTPTDALVAVLAIELQSVALNQPSYTVFCVDDDADFLASLEQFLPRRIEGAFPRFILDFDFFDDPAEAIQAARETEENRLAVVISDQIMPEMKGVELLTEIKRLCPNTQRVLLTGHAGLDAAIEAINERALDKYFTKPIEQSADFANTIQQLLRSYHLHLAGDALRHRLMAQFEFIRLASAAHTLETALLGTVAFVHEQIAAGGVAAMLLEEDHFRVPVTIGETGGLAEETRVPFGDAVAEWVLRHRQPIIAETDADLPEGVELTLPVELPLIAVPLVWGETPLGLLVATGRSEDRPFGRDDRMLMSFIADAASVTLGGLRDREAIEQYYVNTMASLMETVEAKDCYTRGHTDRVMELAVRLAKAAGLAGRDLTDVARAAALHDIGKIAVPEAVITKPGRLDPEEYALMRMHCDRGAKIVRHLGFLDGARDIIQSHHERWDGKGYPGGRAGEAIPLGARILAVVDSYDAMTSDRPYREALDPWVALTEIEVNAGTQFDPTLVNVFLEIMNERLKQAPRGDDLVAAGRPTKAYTDWEPSMN